LPVPEPAAPPAEIEALLDALGDAAAIVDHAGVVRAWNAAAATRHDVSAEDAVGRPIDDLVPGGDSEHPGAVVRFPVRLGEGEEAELRVWRSATTGALDDELVKAVKMDAIGRLAGGIAHDLANPLGAIMGFASMLMLEPRIPDDLRSDVELLRAEAARTHQTVRNLLELARNRPRSVRSIALGPLLRAVLDLASYDLTDVDVHLDLPDDLPEVQADAAEVRQALLHLTLSEIAALGGRNASGWLRIHVRELDGDRPPRVRLSFEDGAPAVPAAERAMLFAPFLPPGVRSVRHGLDLPVAAALLAANGGSIAYQARRDGTGSRLVIELPVAVDDLADATGVADEGPRDTDREAAREAGTGADPGAIGGASARPTRVLVCDDESVVRAVLARVLTRLGYDVVEAGSGPEALGILETEAIDLVLSDHHMAEMNGILLYEAIAERHPRLRRRFVLMTGDGESADLGALVDAAGIRLIPKPFDVTGIPRLMEEVLRA
jgi:signal transduction histidine kinase/CheY-like chemotaxis protein